jgi:hypothetical protein
MVRCDQGRRVVDAVEGFGAGDLDALREAPNQLATLYFAVVELDGELRLGRVVFLGIALPTYQVVIAPRKRAIQYSEVGPWALSASHAGGREYWIARLRGQRRSRMAMTQ